MRTLVAKYYLLLTTLVLLATQGFATEYFFTGEYDEIYENPANWYPAYPGTELGADDKIFFQADASFAGYDIVIEGTLEITIGARIFSRENGIIIKHTGIIQNGGELLVHQIENYGKLSNSISARLDVTNYLAHDGAFTHNGASATFICSDRVINEGVFNNYSICDFRGSFNNKSIFNQIRASVLKVAGTMLFWPDSKLNESTQSKSLITKKVDGNSVESQTSEITLGSL